MICGISVMAIAPGHGRIPANVCMAGELTLPSGLNGVFLFPGQRFAQRVCGLGLWQLAARWIFHFDHFNSWRRGELRSLFSYVLPIARNRQLTRRVRQVLESLNNCLSRFLREPMRGMVEVR